MSEKTFMIFWGMLFFTILVVQGIVFKVNKNSNFQKKFFPLALAINLAVFLLLPIFQFYPSPIIFVFIGIGFLIFFINIKNTKYCDVCEKFRHNKNFLEKMSFCSVCRDKFSK